MRKKQVAEIDTQTPICWTMDWTGDICLGFSDRKYMPNNVATHFQFYRDYFDANGKPILSKLPMDCTDLYNKKIKKTKFKRRYRNVYFNPL